MSSKNKLASSFDYFSLITCNICDFWLHETICKKSTVSFILDSALLFDKQVNGGENLFFFQLRWLAKVKGFLTCVEFERLIPAFTSSCLEYCNLIHIGIGQSHVDQLQVVQNTADMLLTGTCKFEHMTPFCTP